jgi:hypothetical protein
MHAADLPVGGRLDPERSRVLQGFVRRLLTDQQVPAAGSERRRTARQAYPQAMLLTPCAKRREPRVEETVMVVGKDLSRNGVGFVHTRALREEHVVITLRQKDSAPISLLTVIRRVQPLRHGLYLIGGEFVERITMEETDGGPAATSAAADRQKDAD